MFDPVVLERLLMFTNNQTAQWLQEKSADERDTLIDASRRAAPKFCENLEARQQTIHDCCMEQVKEKEAGSTRKKEQHQKKKETLTEITAVGGLWISKEAAQEQLSKMFCVTDERLALNSQLHFCKFVLLQKVQSNLVCTFYWYKGAANRETGFQHRTSV
eukprot:scpid15251/ scgid18849/ 